MNTLELMDKQIMEFSGSQEKQPHVEEGNDDQSNDKSHDVACAGGGGGEDGVGPQEEIVTSYDFYEILTPIVDSPPPPAPPPPPSPLPPISLPTVSSSSRYELSASHETSSFVNVKGKEASDAAMLMEIDCAIKKHTDSLLYLLEGISSRLSHLETRTCELESSVHELKLTFGDNIGDTDEKLRQLEVVLREVQTGVQILHDNRKLLEVQQPAKAQNTMLGHQYFIVPPPHTVQQPPAAPQQQHNVKTGTQVLSDNREPLEPPQPQRAQNTTLDYQYFTEQQPHNKQQPPAVQQQESLAAPQKQHSPQPSLPQQHLALTGSPASPSENSPPTPLQQATVQSSPAPAQTQISCVFSLPGQSSPTGQPSFPPSQPQYPRDQQYRSPLQQSWSVLPHQQHLQPLQQRYQVPPNIPPYSQNPPAQAQPPLALSLAENPPFVPQPQQTYPLVSHPSSASLSSRPQQFYHSSPRIYEASVRRPSLGLMPSATSCGISPRPGFTEQYELNCSSSHYTSSLMKPPPFSSLVSVGEENNHSHLPTAKLLPEATPVVSGPGGTSGNRVPIDDVVDKVASMGFSREQVRKTVDKLTENGQSVDLNVVLDKLMNGGGDGRQS